MTCTNFPWREQMEMLHFMWFWSQWYFLRTCRLPNGLGPIILGGGGRIPPLKVYHLLFLSQVHLFSSTIQRQTWLINETPRIRTPRGKLTAAPLGRVQLKCDGTRWHTGGDVKGKLANGVCSQYPSHYLATWFIQHYYRWCAHLGCQ